jgi:hypothetical protein
MSCSFQIDEITFTIPETRSVIQLSDWNSLIGSKFAIMSAEKSEGGESWRFLIENPDISLHDCIKLDITPLTDFF